jgi:hypothetical protein
MKHINDHVPDFKGEQGSRNFALNGFNCPEQATDGPFFHFAN